MTTPTILSLYRALLAERLDLRPTNVRRGLSVVLRYDDALDEWRWAFNDGFSDYCSDFDALAHCHSYLAMRVAEARIWILAGPLVEGSWWVHWETQYDSNVAALNFPSYDEALVAGAREIKQK